jgi:ribosomal protein L11 methyltransferase
MISGSASSNAAGQWLKLTFFCPSRLLEPAADLLGVLSGAGVEQSPETETGALVSGFFQLPAGSDDAAHPDATAILADEDWATSWQQYFKTFEIIPGLVIKPSWEEYQAEPGQHVLELDPGMAFGTGQHASTRMALALLARALRDKPRPRALDVGTGTGILAMASAAFGAERVLAVDNDPEAVTVARENIAINRMEGVIEVGLTPAGEIEDQYQLVLANIVHDVLVDLAPALTRLTEPGGCLVLAGILAGPQEENILAVYGRLGCRLLESQHQDEWAALLLERS